MVRSYYRVAEHLFAVECSDSALLQYMKNYEPFREPTPNPSLNAPHDAGVIGDPAKGRELGEEIFTLRVEGDEAKGEVHPINSQSLSGTPQRQEARGEEWTHVLTDNAEEDMPRIEVYRSCLEDGAERLQDASLSAPQKSADFSGTPLQDAETAIGRPEGLSVVGYRSGGWLLRVAVEAKAPISCEIECNEDFTQGVLYIMPDCQDVRFCIDNALMLLYAFRTAPLMTLEMHAAVVVRDESRGYLFLGHSGTGKSTHARQWLAAFDDAWLLNDDNPILRVMEDGEVRVYGSPWSGKTPCYKNAYARVGGIVKLSQAPHNKIRTISLPEAYAYMLSSASGMKMDRHMADCMYESIKHVITHVKCYHLDCLPNTEAAEVAQRGME